MSASKGCGREDMGILYQSNRDRQLTGLVPRRVFRICAVQSCSEQIIRGLYSRRGRTTKQFKVGIGV